MHLRAMALTGDVYHTRSIFQMAIISVAFASCKAFLCLRRRGLTAAATTCRDCVHTAEYPRNIAGHPRRLRMLYRCAPAG